MNVSRSLAFAAGLLGLSWSSAIAATPLTSLVDGQTPIVFSIHDLPGLLKNWEKSPWAKTWNDEQMKKFLAPLRTEMKISEWDEHCKEETGYTVQELLAFATGDGLIALKNFDFPLDGSANSGDVPLLIALEVGSNAAKIEGLIADAEKKHAGGNRETEEFSGVTIHIVKETSKSGSSDDTVWAFADGIGLLSPSKNTVMAAIDAIKRGGVDNPLGQSEAFLRTRQRVGDAQVNFFVNMQAVFPALQKAVQAKAGNNGQPNQLGIDPASVLTALGLDAINEIYLSGHVGEDQSETYFGVTYSDVRGLIKLIAYRDGPPPQPDFLPARAVAGTAAKFSVKDFYAGLEELLENVSPVISGIVQGQIKNYNKQLGIDLKRDLIGSIGDTIATATLLPPGASLDAPPAADQIDALYAISLDNATAFTAAADAIKRMLFGPDADTTVFNKRDYLGTSLYTFNTPEPQPGQPRARGFSYAISKNYVFVGVGSPAPVEAALQGLGGGQSSFWDKADVKRALSDVPANAVSFAFQDARLLVPIILQTVNKTVAQPPAAAKRRPRPAAPNPDGDAAQDAGAPDRPATPFDPTALPDPAVIAKYWSSVYGYAIRESNGFHAKSTVLHPK